MPTVHDSVAAARAGIEPALVCRVPSGWVTLCAMQYLREYCILQADPVVDSLNALDRALRAAFLCDMATVGDALLEVTGAYRVNYFIGGNSDPALHAHIVPRYAWEEKRRRKDGPWSYPQEVKAGRIFDAVLDRKLIEAIAAAIQRRI